MVIPKLSHIQVDSAGEKERGLPTLMGVGVSWEAFQLLLASALWEDQLCPFSSWPHLRRAQGRNLPLGCGSLLPGGGVAAWWDKHSQILIGEAGSFSSSTIPLST